MNRIVTLTFWALLGVAAAAYTAVSWDRARARGEAWDFSWHGAALVGVAFVILVLGAYGVRLLRDNVSSNNARGASALAVAFGLGVAAGIALASIDIEWSASLRTLAIGLIALVWLAVLLAIANRPNIPTPIPSQT